MQVPVELKLKYLERKVQDLQILTASLEEDDFAPAVKLGHQVKGNALTFDFPDMAPLGSEIEQAAKNHDKEKLEKLIQMMNLEIQEARSKFH